MEREHNTSFGVFKPHGHTVISFPSADQAQEAHRALTQSGIAEDAIRQYTDLEMLSQIGHDLENASPLASVGQELNLVLAHQKLGEIGYHWLVVHTPDDAVARQVADLVKPLGAERAQLYGRFIIEEMIEHEGDTAPVSDSPDRGLDPRTPSGLEEERAELRPPPDAAP